MTGGMKAVNRAEIDTTAPFRSVKEAVMLFGEKVLAGEVYANKIKDQTENEGTEDGNDPPTLSTIITTDLELEETKESLQKAREESMLMAHCLSALQEELEQTKRELEQMKERESEKQVIVTDIRDVEYMENSNEFDVKTRLMNEGFEFQKKRYVTFANPPSLARVMVPQGDDLAVLERHPSLRKKKKKPLIPLIGGIFSKKKGRAEVV